MNAQQARALITETFPQPFDEARFRSFAINLLNHIDESKAQAWNTTYIKDAFKGHVRGYKRLGTYTSPEKEKLDVLIVHLTTEAKLERARTAIRNFVADHLKTRDNKDAALVAFVSPTEKQWRLSFVKMEYAAIEKEGGKVGVQTKLTPARRSSYIVGEGESCHTAQSRFLDLLQDTENHPTLAQIEDAFSVEAVTREFFEQYKALFLDLKDELDDLAKGRKDVGTEFTSRGISTADFGKKLMGQIVFLYFMQKKGWLGVPKHGDWGNGPHDFLRQLFDGKFGPYENFFNDILEPLFYDTLATDRGHEAWDKTLNCRIPFLNGGLFEPLAGYDWKGTDIIIPNALFSNAKTAKAGDTATGILDVFDRYNFTVNEAEPLEKEVAIDPEMLGKVFENLLEVKERKSKGSFYTPREIVHYMCRESLISYLDTALNTAEESIAPAKPKQTRFFGDPEPVQASLKRTVRREVVPRGDIETFIHLGDQISHYEAVETRYAIKMPKSIEQNARLIDENLAGIAVCDPAVGSGAFPVGMMHEIVRARSALTPYFNDVHDRTAYHFKRHAIQNSLYGVDIDPGAVEIAKLRLWLSLVVDEDDVRQIKPLPNLDFKIVVGNSLLGVERDLLNANLFERLEGLKPRFFDATDRKQKGELKHEIDDLIHELTNGKEAFDFETYFSEVFHRKNGFDVTIGNPPYVRADGDERHAKIRKAILDSGHYETLWEKWDLYVPFIERGYKLLKPGGVTTMIVSDAFCHAKYAQKAQNWFLKNARILRLDFCTDLQIFDAAVHNLIYRFQRADGASHTPERHVHREEFGNVTELASDEQAKLTNRVFFPEDTARQVFKCPSEMLSRICYATVGMVVNAHEDLARGAFTMEDLVQDSCDSTHPKRFVEGKHLGMWLPLCHRWLEWGTARAPDLFRRPTFPELYEVPEKILVQRSPGPDPKCCYDNQHLHFTESTVAFIPWHALAGVRNNSLKKTARYRGEKPPRPDLPKREELEETSRRFSLKYLLGVMNSSAARDFLRANRRSNIHLYPDDWKQLPIPSVAAEQQKPVERLVERILSAKQRDAGADVSALEREMDELVSALYGLTPGEIKLVEGAAKPDRVRS